MIHRECNEYRECNELRKEVVTGVFTPGSALYARREMRRWIRRMWVPVVLPVIALCAVAAAASDWRFIVVAAAVCFMVYPPVAMLGWFGAMSRQDAVRAIYPRKVSISADGSITIVYLNRKEKEKDGDKEEESDSAHGDSECSEDGDEKPALKLPPPLTITPEEITGSEMSGKLIAIEYCLDKHRNERQCELIPVSAFDTTADAMRFIGRFCRVE